MKIISTEHLQGKDLVEDDLYLPGHISPEELAAITTNASNWPIAIRLTAALPDELADEAVTRLNIERRTWTHGLRSTYGSGCRCPTCTAAQRDYMRGYSSDRRAADRAEREPIEA